MIKERRELENPGPKMEMRQREKRGTQSMWSQRFHVMYQAAKSLSEKVQSLIVKCQSLMSLSFSIVHNLNKGIFFEEI